MVVEDMGETQNAVSLKPLVGKSGNQDYGTTELRYRQATVA